jgi:hypothetical protein
MIKRVIIAVGYFSMSMDVLHFSRSARKMEYKRYFIFFLLFVFRSQSEKRTTDEMARTMLPQAKQCLRARPRKSCN